MKNFVLALTILAGVLLMTQIQDVSAKDAASDKAHSPETAPVPETVEFEGSTYTLVKSDALKKLIVDKGISAKQGDLSLGLFKGDGSHKVWQERGGWSFGRYTTSNNRLCLYETDQKLYLRCLAVYEYSEANYIASYIAPEQSIIRPFKILIN
jgi:hypothetical protein